MLLWLFGSDVWEEFHFFFFYVRRGHCLLKLVLRMLFRTPCDLNNERFMMTNFVLMYFSGCIMCLFLVRNTYIEVGLLFSLKLRISMIALDF